jgi:hypothetical protein
MRKSAKLHHLAAFGWKQQRRWLNNMAVFAAAAVVNVIKAGHDTPTALKGTQFTKLNKGIIFALHVYKTM